MSWSQWIRQGHRWGSMVFTATVIACFIGVAMGEPPMWLFYTPLPPLFALLFSGLYLFVLPYLSRWRSGRSIARG